MTQSKPSPEIEQELKELKEQHLVIHERLDDHERIMTNMDKHAAETRDAIIAMRDILETWNDAKGFVKGITLFGNTLRWLALLGASIGAIVYFFKTGTWK